jgi:hypothetical protein
MKEQTLEYCQLCGDATGKAGAADGSIFCNCGAGPFCLPCWRNHWCVDKAFCDDPDETTVFRVMAVEWTEDGGITMQWDGGLWHTTWHVDQFGGVSETVVR